METSPILVVAAVILSRDTILLHQRRKGDTLEGTWEFPGGKVEEGETPVEALTREIREELGIGIRVEEKLGEIIHNYPHAHIKLMAFKALTPTKRIYSNEGKIRWVSPHEIEGYNLSPADIRLWKKIKDALVHK